MDELGRPDLRAALASAGPGTAVYCCGPAAMTEAVEQACADLGMADRLHLERFSAEGGDEGVFDPADNTEFEVHLARTGATMRVPVGERLIEVVREAVPVLSYDCEKGSCGAGETRVIAGTPEHRDSVLSPGERGVADHDDLRRPQRVAPAGAGPVTSPPSAAGSRSLATTSRGRAPPLYKSGGVT
jgi:ferredoxin